MEAPKFNPAPAQAESKLHFLDYWRIIRIRKTVILAVFLLVVLTTTAVTFILPETFMSTARIEVQKDTPDIPSLITGNSMSGAYDPYFIQTEFEKIKSTKVLHRVIEDLGLRQEWAKRYGVDNLRLNDAYRMLLKQTDLRQFRNTSLIEIRAYSDDKQEAANIANKIAEVYQQARIQTRSQLSQSGIAALEEEFAKQKKSVEEVQNVVDKLRQDLKVTDLGNSLEYQSVAEQQIVPNLDRDRLRAEQIYREIAQLYEELSQKSNAELRKVIPTAYKDQHMDSYLASLAEARQRYAAMINDYSDTHPEVLKLTSVIKELDEQVNARVEGVLEGLRVLVATKKAQADSLREAVEKAKAEDAENREKYAPFFRAKRELETQQRILDTIFMRILAEKVDSKIPKSSSVEIVDQASVEDRPVRPNVPLNITLGVLVGLIMGFGLAFFIEYLDTSVKTIDDVERALQAPVLGVIPQNVGTLIQEGPDSPHAEAYRVLRTNLLFSRKDPTANTITVVSGGAGEGKSTTIFNLATVFAQNGARVLLVDSDLRRPSLHKMLNVSNSLGLTNLLLKQNTMEEVVQTTGIPSLHFLPSGKLPSSSLGILNSTQMREFVKQAKERYDFVFFDSPPIMGVSDASVLASEVDMALLVIQYRKYPQVMTIRAKNMVQKVGGNLLGVVLNNINISQDSYYYYYSGYYYDYYSKHDDEGKPAKNGEAKNGEAKKAGERSNTLEIKQKY